MAKHSRREPLPIWAHLTIAVAALVLFALVIWAAVGAWSEPAAPTSELLRKSGSSASSAPATVPTSSEVATPSVAPTPPPPTPPRKAPAKPATKPEPRTPFNAARAMADVRWIEGFGVRQAGSTAESRTANAIAKRLSALGYKTEVDRVPLGNGRTSVNVHALSRGPSARTIVLGAHIDSKRPSPGANDNATGAAALLEIARILASHPATASVELVFFGAEEAIDKNPDHHHYGSRAYVRSMSTSARANTAGMVSVDMIGHGPDFVVRSMERSPRSLVTLMLARAKASGVGLKYLKDPGSTGWSDHEAFELAGIPAAWIEWRDDPVYHTAADTSGHIKSARVATAGSYVLNFVRGLKQNDLETLVKR